MADILDFHRLHTSTKEPEPLWRESLGRVLRAIREQQGGRLVDVAERAGISPQYLSEIERGRKEPSSEMIAAVTGALGVDLAERADRHRRRHPAAAGHPPGDRPPPGGARAPGRLRSGPVAEDLVGEAVSHGARRVEHAVPVGVAPQVREVTTGVRREDLLQLGADPHDLVGLRG